jgi:DNA damage-regulated autophagy modulator protein 2
MAIISRQRLHWYAPIVGATALLTTLATCFIITRVKGIYVGGLSWPFFSDMGREAPAYYVFITGLSIVAIALSIMWQLNGKFQRSVFTEETKPIFHWAVSIATAFGACSPIGLPILVRLLPGCFAIPSCFFI